MALFPEITSSIIVLYTEEVKINWNDGRKNIRGRLDVNDVGLIEKIFYLKGLKLDEDNTFILKILYQ